MEKNYRLNFLDYHSQNKRKEQISPTKKSTTREAVKKIIFLILIIIIFCLVISIKDFFLIRKSYQETLNGKFLASQGKSYLMETDFLNAGQSFIQANQIFQSAGSRLDNLIILDKLPWFKDQISIFQKIVLIGNQTSSALKTVTPLADELYQSVKQAKSVKELTREKKKELLDHLVKAQPQLQAAKAEIQISKNLLSQVSQTETVKQIQNIIKVYKEELEPNYDLLEKAIAILQISPGVLGYQEEKNYLFLFQNNTELRPGGGFIGSYGVLKIKNGDILSFQIDDVYNLDRLVEGKLIIPAPQPMCQQANWCNWYFRDSNWSPDWPKSAQKVLYFYQKEREIAGQKKLKIDGVIGVDLFFVQSLLELVGPVEIKGIEFNHKNFIDTLQELVEIQYHKEGIPKIERKLVLNDLYQEILNKVLKLSLKDYNRFWLFTRQNIKEKHILSYFLNPEVQNFISKNGWQGEVKDVPGDYLMVVDSNLRSLKTDRVMKRDISYSLSIEDNKPIANLSINYQNQGQIEDWRTTRYRNYLRVYVPLGSKLINSTGLIENEKSQKPIQAETYFDLGKTVFAGFTIVPLRQNRTITFKYQLPDEILDQVKKGQYNLYVQKQLGTKGHRLSINLKFDKKIKSARMTERNSDKSQGYVNQTEFNSDLSIDREIEVKF